MRVPSAARLPTELEDVHAPIAARAFAVTAADQPLSPYSFERRDPGPDDVAIAIKYCGVCHSDLHAVQNDLGGSVYPLVPGHEIAGVVTAVGAHVTRFKEGDRVGVGCMVYAAPVPPARPARSNTASPA